MMVGLAMRAEVVTVSGGLNGTASSRKTGKQRPLAPTVLVMMFDTPEQLAEIRALMNGERTGPAEQAVA